MNCSACLQYQQPVLGVQTGHSFRPGFWRSRQQPRQPCSTHTQQGAGGTFGYQGHGSCHGALVAPASHAYATHACPGSRSTPTPHATSGPECRLPWGSHILQAAVPTGQPRHGASITCFSGPSANSGSRHRAPCTRPRAASGLQPCHGAAPIGPYERFSRTSAASTCRGGIPGPFFRR
jgi:hypothetical protein